MPKAGQARVPTTEEWQRVFEVIQDHRHPEKNAAIMQISAKLGLRAQEIALLQIKEVARLKKSPPGFTLVKKLGHRIHRLVPPMRCCPQQWGHPRVSGSPVFRCQIASPLCAHPNTIHEGRQLHIREFALA